MFFLPLSSPLRHFLENSLRTSASNKKGEPVEVVKLRLSTNTRNRIYIRWMVTATTEEERQNAAKAGVLNLVSGQRDVSESERTALIAILRGKPVPNGVKFRRNKYKEKAQP